MLISFIEEYQKVHFSWKHRLRCNEENNFTIYHQSGIFYQGQSNYEEFDKW